MIAKKNFTIKAAVLMLALVLITSCFVGGTFAKYVTSGSGSDTARVAKFGVTINANGTMFAKEYATDAQTVGTITQSVVSSNDDKLVAPGTKGDMAKMTLTGTPEVAVKVTYDATGNVSLGDNWKDADGKFYCPLVFHIKSATGTTHILGTDYNTAALLESEIVKAINGHSKEYAANTDLAEKGGESLNVSWEWLFETGKDDAEKAANNIKDTYLGNQAAKGNAATVSIEIATTVTQID